MQGSLQRLTTANLLFLALHNGLGAGDVSARDPHLQGRVCKEYLQSEYSSSGHKLKLKPVKADAAAYAKLSGDPVFRRLALEPDELVLRLAPEVTPDDE